MKDIHVGQKYRDQDGNTFIVSCVQGFYSLICFDVDRPDNNIYLGMSYVGQSTKIKDVFGGMDHLFTKIH